MNVEDTQITSQPPNPELSLTSPSDRYADIEAKQALVARLLVEEGCDGLLISTPDNFTWLTAGGAGRGIADKDARPALYFSAEGRWLLSANVDTQRMFDEEIDSLGFQLKEWPWHWGRKQLVADLCQGRNVACDESHDGCKPIVEQLRKMRCVLSEYERACYRALGQVISHALEATGRTLAQGDTEREIAGQLSHRLLHRGAQPLVISVAADGRSGLYRQGGYTATPVTNTCLLTLAARKYGLCAQASRAVCFGQPGEVLRHEHDAACKVSATYVASSWPDSVPRQILASGQRVYQMAGRDHEWTLTPQGHVTGRALAERTFLPGDVELLQANCAVTWCASVGAATSCDTFLITEEGPRAITPAENWPLKRIRIQGSEFVRPDVLVR